ncbi:protein kinase domain-containing protein [Limnoglobus roseus]|uniref:Putative beta-jelly-roll-type glycoside hydrolase and serine/threonine-protein kinase PknB n=1 Tax=Limnoglobus roseus TaxID=2598579 RepID=A0A5C1A6L8_9BACT|nr:family 16 glycoside hydrolase [Limnoglobus roseus]QEL13636.1 putative beta-jelly-roll-type glycoside hydrolase and serine/threonine-protein kinase PknB [Limnoglobus roseus]
MNEPNSARTRPLRPEEADTRPPTRADHTPSGYNPRDGGLRFGPPAAADEIGTLGRFRVQKELGHGGMGAVYLAFDTQLHRPIALKVMLSQLATHRTTKERFIREARSAAQITHDNVIGILEAGEIDGVPFIAMPFLQGYPLDEFLHKKGTPSTNQILRIGREMALGLAAAHDLGVIHRDIKPGNVWLEAPNGRVKILDFGLAKPQDEDKELTHTGQIMGTPAYMAPEQAAGEKVDHRADLYSLGTVLYRLVAGRTPFEPARDMMSMLVALALDEPKPLRELNPVVPPALAELVHELLRKDRTARPQSGKEVAKRLGAMLKQSLAGGREPPKTEDVLPATAPLPITPVQPTPYVAVPITAQNNVSAFEEIDEAPRRRGHGISAGKVVWLIAALAVVTAGVVIVNQHILSPESPSAEGKTNRRVSLDMPPATMPAKDVGQPTPDGPTSVFSDATPTRVFTKPGAKPSTPAGGWVPLTAGKSLADWDAFHAGGWSLTNDVLSADGAAAGWLGTKRYYTDFELELEYRLPPKGNSGIFLRAWNDGPGTGGNFVELQLLDNSAYTGLTETQKNGAIHNKIAPNFDPVSPVDLWNNLHVSVIGKRVTATFNGTKCVDADVNFPREDGRIGLQASLKPVEFRNVRVRELKD